MRLFASMVWITAFSFSALISGILPVHAPFAAAHATSDPSSATRSVANQSIYAGYAPGYGPTPSCQVSSSFVPPGWPSSPPYAPFSQNFDTFLNNQITVPPGSAPQQITIAQSAPQIVTPRGITSLPNNASGQPYQLLYNGQFPGPTIRVVSQQTDQSTLTVESDADTDAPPLTQLAIANGVIGQNTNVPFPYFTTHLHGGHTAPEHDGHPDDLLPPMPPMSGGVGTPVGSGQPPTHVYSYTNDQQPQILWYHDHADMNTSPHVAQGLYAFYILEEAPEDPSYPYLPKGKYDVPLGLQVQQAGTQAPPPASELPLDPNTGQPPVLNSGQSAPAYVVTVNGVDSPGMTVDAQYYRFRVLNASAGQSISLELCDGNGNNLNNLAYLIGTDGGMMPAPVNLAQRTIDPFGDGRLDVFQAERYDLLIDFSNLSGRTVYLSAIVRGPNACMQSLTTTSGAQICWNQQMPIVAFNVGYPSGSDPTNISMIGNRSWAADTAALQAGHSQNGSFDQTPNRVFTFDHYNSQWVISGQPFSPYRLTNGGVASSGGTIQFPQAINPALIHANAVDLWELQNTVACATHPVHVHDIEFQNVTVNGQTLSAEQVAQFGWKDIFVLMPMYSATACPWAPMNTAPSISFMGNFEAHWTQATAPPSPQIGDTVPWLQTPSSGPYTALTAGTYVFHCHNLGHEDNVMMGQFQVLPPPFTPPSGGAQVAPPPSMNMGHSP